MIRIVLALRYYYQSQKIIASTISGLEACVHETFCFTNKFFSAISLVRIFFLVATTDVKF